MVFITPLFFNYDVISQKLQKNTLLGKNKSEFNLVGKHLVTNPTIWTLFPDKVTRKLQIPILTLFSVKKPGNPGCLFI